MAVLVTGGAGFIGSNFIRCLREKEPRTHIVNADALTYAGNLENLADMEGDENYTFVHADIRDRDAMERIFLAYDIDRVVNFAAESHVDRSIVDPEIFLTTNVIGASVLMDTAKKHWKLSEDKYDKTYKPGVKFLQVSTDEVYGALGKTGFFTEETPLSPNSPYSASKASADMLARAYANTYGLPVNVTRCSNNYGPCQFPEKGETGRVYNIGGNNEKANIDIVKLILKTLHKGEELITYVKDRPGHDRRYAIDNSRITSELGWAPAYTFEQGMAETIEWYLAHGEWMEHVRSGAYMDYYERMYRQ